MPTWDQLSDTDPTKLSWDSLLDSPPAPKPIESRGVGGFLKDTGLDLAKGVVGLGESAVGIADLATGGYAGKGLAALGYDPKQTNAFLSGLQSDARQQSDREVSQADGFWDTLKTLGTHPDALFGNIVQSLPGSIGAGAAGGMLVKKIAGVAATEAGVLGLTGKAAEEFIASKVTAQTFKIASVAGAAEGAQTAGSIAEGARQQGRDWDQYVAPAIAAGLGTAAIGMVSGKIASKLRIGDLETDIAARAAGVKGAGIGGGNIATRTGKEMLKEGILEEMPQSYQEQGFQNLAMAKPWEEGTGSAAAQGLLAGAGMAGGHAVLSGRNEPAKPTEPTTPDAIAAKITAPEVQTVDEAVAIFKESVTPTNFTATPTGLIGSMIGATAGPGFDARSVAGDYMDEQDFAQLAQTEQRDLQVMRANIQREQADAADSLTAHKVYEANQLEGPSAFELALQEARQRQAPIEPEPAASTEAVSVSEPRIVERTADMTPMPKELAELQVDMDGGEVVRIQNRNGKFAYTVIKEANGTDSNLQPVATGTAGSGAIEPDAGMGTGVGVLRPDAAAPVGIDPAPQSVAVSQSADTIGAAVPDAVNQPVVPVDTAQAATESVAPAATAVETVLSRAKPVNEAPAVVLQNRDRSSAASIAQMNEIAANPDYLRAGQSSVMDSGAPVVFGDIPKTALVGKSQPIADGKGQRTQIQYAVVEASDLIASHQADGTAVDSYANGEPGKLRAVAGNGRTAGIVEGYNRQTAKTYRQDLIADVQSVGIDPQSIEGMKAPVLVRVMNSKDVTADIGDRSNIASAARLSSVEQAATDSRRLNLETLEFHEDGAPTQAAVTQFVRSMPTSEQSELIGPDGTPTKQAVDRLMAATFKQAYGSDELVSLYAQAQDSEARTIMSGLADAAGSMSSLKDAGEHDIRGAIAEAAGFAVNARRQGLKLSDMLKTRDMTMSDEALVVAQFMADNVRSAKKISEGLRNAADLAAEQAQIVRDNKDQGGMFGETPVASREDIFRKLNGNKEIPKNGIRNTTGAEGSEAGAVQPTGERQDGQEVGRVAPGSGNAQASAEVLTSPTQADVLAQQDRTANTQELDQREQIQREASHQTLTAPVAPEQRSDTGGDMFALEKAQAEIDKRNTGKAAKQDPNQSGMFDAPAEMSAADHLREAARKMDEAAKPKSDAIAPKESNLPISDKSIPDSGAMHSEQFANLLKSLPSNPESFGDMDVKSQREMVSSMISSVGDLKVRRAIVELVPVDVMDDLIGSKGSSEQFLHNPSMFRDSFSIQKPELSVPIARFFDTLRETTAIIRTKVLDGLREAGGRYEKGNSAEIADSFNFRDETTSIAGNRTEVGFPDGGSVSRNREGNSTTPTNSSNPQSGAGISATSRTEISGRENLGGVNFESDSATLTGSSSHKKIISDLGEKIGGARKDVSTSTGPRSQRTTEDDGRATWAKRFHIGQVAGGFDISENGKDITGKWMIHDTKNKDWTGQPKQVGKYFSSKEEAEAALPLIAVAQKHRVVPVRVEGYKPPTEAEVDAQLQKDIAAKRADENAPGKHEYAMMKLAKSRLESGSITQAEYDRITPQWAEKAAQYKPLETPAERIDATMNYEIWRDINDHKRVKVVDQKFATRNDAMRYMAEHATEILETNTTFGEADIPKPESTLRVGVERRTGDVVGNDFKDTFGFRGVEFGNWNNQTERQEVMNAAFDGLHDLAEVLGIPPKAIGLNGDLALAFGARGHGLTSARAHYEPERAVMNLTKMNGAGALAHEWFHALDHYLGRQDGKAAAEWKVNKDGTRTLETHAKVEDDFVSSGFKYNSNVREELKTAYATLVKTLFTKAEQYVEDTAKADKFVGKTRDDLKTALGKIRADLAEQKDVRYYKRNNKPGSAEQLAEFDAIAAELIEGRGLATDWMSTAPTAPARPGLRGRFSSLMAGRHTNESLEKLSEIYKAVRGRSGFDSTHQSGMFDNLRGYMSRYNERLKMLADANNATEKTKRVPTSFAMDAKSLDQGRGKDYWTTPHEMVARAFQGYVEDMIAAKDGKSPFLNYAPENLTILTPWGAKRPFPSGDERKAMNSAFDAFVREIKTKETPTGTAMFSRTWRSALADGIEALNVKAQHQEGWRAQIQGMVNKGTVKADEVEWSGINEFLKLQEGKVSKEQVSEFLKNNGVQVQEVVLGDEDADVATARWLEARAQKDFGKSFDSLSDDDQDYLRGKADDSNISASNPTKYATYQLPGGSNYREVLLTLPVKSTAEPARAEYEAWAQRNGLRPNATMTEQRYERETGNAAPAPRTMSEMQADAAQNFKSSHWDQKNVLAHIRLNDRVDAEGRKILFVEELQSDWGQDGKKKGFANDSAANKDRIKELLAEHTALNNGIVGRQPNEAEAARFAAINAEDSRLRGEVTRASNGGIPAAPFVGKTDAWLTLALKRVIKMAVDGSYDKVAFINGEQSAERYSLDKQVGSVTYTRDINGGTLVATDRQDKSFVISETNVTPEKLSDFVGKDVAEKLLASPLKDGSQTLRGNDLKVPQGGMRAFYDSIVPNTTNALLKKLGGGKVESVSVNGKRAPTFAMKGRTAADPRATSYTEQTGFAITDAMREHAAKGMPMFSQTGAQQSSTFDTNEANREKTDRLQHILTRQGNDFTITPVSLPVDDIGPATRGEVGTGPSNHFKLAERIASIFGKEVVWITANGPFSINGVVVPGGTLSKYVFVSANADHPAHVVLGHELTHHIEKEAPGVYKALVKAMSGLLKNHDGYRESRGLPSDATEFEVTKEMIGDLMGDNFDKREFWNRVSQESNGTYFKMIANSVTKWLTALLNKLKLRGLGSHAFTTDVAQARDVLAKAVADYANTKGKPALLNDGSVAPQFSAINEPVTNSKDVVGNQGGRSADDSTLGVEPLRLAPYSHAEMIARGADGNLSRGYERYVPIDKLDGLEPVPSNNESDDGEYHPGQPITQPIEVQANIADGTFMVYSGNHRIAQAKANGQTHILAFVEPDPSDSLGIKKGSVSRTNPDSNESTAPDSGGAQFSRSVITGKTNKIVSELNDRFTHVGTLSAWHKTVGTQYNLAKRNKYFKRTFDAVQNFINDTSYYATEAANEAKTLLPQLKSWRDIFRSAIKSDDNKALSKPVFEGTLIWGRDESGRLVKLADLEAKYADLTSEQKAQRLLRNGIVTEAQLKRWQGSPLDIYDGAVRNRFKATFLKEGVVFTDAELKAEFNLTPNQIGLYHEFRAAVDKSITNLVITDMLKYGGDDTAQLRDMALAEKDVSKAAEMLAEYLRSMADMDTKRAELLRDTADKMILKADKAKDLIDHGYAPLSRFGHYTLDVVEDGERLYFGMFESKNAANKMAAQMKANYPKAEQRQGTVSEEDYKLFAGVSPETIELFGEMLGLEEVGTDAKDKAFQEYLKIAKSQRSAMKRLIHRKGIAGFSEDATRVLAGFVYSNARQSSSNLHTKEIAKSAAEIPQGMGEVKDQAVKLMNYVQNPQEEAQAIRGLLFAQYIGGSVASAMVNLTQPFTMTIPWLSQYGGIGKATKQMTAATKDAFKKSTGDAGLDAALKHAEELGIVSPQEVHQMQAQAQGKGALQSGDGTHLGDASAMANNSLSRVTLAWGKLFGVAEQFNRRSTFIAAYRTAVEQKIQNPMGFAEEAVEATQGIYNKGNKPAWARGAMKGTLMTFKQFSINYVEMLDRMWRSGPEGKKATLYALGILMLSAGAGGLPGADDLDDLISGLLQAMGYNFDSKAKRRAFLTEHLGSGAAKFIEHGITGLPGVPIDVSGRLGLGNLIPGTGLLTKKADHTRDVAELAGPAGDLVKRGFNAAGKLAKGDVVDAGLAISPTAIRNLEKAYDMQKMGMYRDSTGNKVIDTDGYDALSKAIGFNPQAIKQVQDATGEVPRTVGLNKLTESEIADKWAQGLFEKNQDKVQEARDNLATWNKSNPDMPIRIQFSQIYKRVQSMRMTKEQRILKTTPKEVRNTIRQELATQ